jgi:hypothetical protein
LGSTSVPAFLFFIGFLTGVDKDFHAFVVEGVWFGEVEDIEFYLFGGFEGVGYFEVVP